MAMVRRVVCDESVAPKLEIVEPHVGQGGLAALDIQLRQPGQLCNNLLHEFLVRVGLGESAHILQVPGPKTAHFRKGLLKSSESRSMTLAPQPSLFCRFRMFRPMLQ
jgi:hypothetical protein